MKNYYHEFLSYDKYTHEQFSSKRGTTPFSKRQRIFTSLRVITRIGRSQALTFCGSLLSVKTVVKNCPV